MRVAENTSRPASVSPARRHRRAGLARCGPQFFQKSGFSHFFEALAQQQLVVRLVRPAGFAEQVEQLPPTEGRGF